MTSPGRADQRMAPTPPAPEPKATPPGEFSKRPTVPLPLHRTEASYPRCATCDGGGCPDCTDPA